jgi:hypothetical protein
MESGVTHDEFIRHHREVKIPLCCAALPNSRVFWEVGDEAMPFLPIRGLENPLRYIPR